MVLLGDGRDGRHREVGIFCWLQKKNRKGRAAAATAKMTFSRDAGLLSALLQLQPFSLNSGIALPSPDPKTSVRAAPAAAPCCRSHSVVPLGENPQARLCSRGCAALRVRPPAAESCSRGCLLRGCSASFVRVRDREVLWHQSAPVHGCGAEPQVPWSVRICILSEGFLCAHPTLRLAYRSTDKCISLISGSSTELRFFWLFP